MENFTQEQIDQALIEIENMDQETMCRLWRFQPVGSIYFNKDIATYSAFHRRLFLDFGGFTAEISKQIGHEQPLERDTLDLREYNFNQFKTT